MCGHVAGAVVSRVDFGRHVGRVDVLRDRAGHVSEANRHGQFGGGRREGARGRQSHFEVGRAGGVALERSERSGLVDVARGVHTTSRSSAQAP